MPARPQRIDHGLLRGLLQLPQARGPSGRALRRSGSPTAAPGRSAQADRWSGRPAHRHRAGDQAGTSRERLNPAFSAFAHRSCIAAASSLTRMSATFRSILAGGLLTAAAATVIALPVANAAPCNETVGNSINSYLQRHPDLHRQLEAKSEAEGGGPN